MAFILCFNSLKQNQYENTDESKLNLTQAGSDLIMLVYAFGFGYVTKREEMLHKEQFKFIDINIKVRKVFSQPYPTQNIYLICV